ncbi:MAG: 1-deoxy-D-xylulose-5-phosphate reductoisomerase [Candidatus Omnitrophota bacterium]|nr:1-deoxy-D-xylulose-5-phosphate reductoisomerase [Candidatus Omnitrophota bacterium]
MKNIVILGSTGSIGVQALRVIEDFPEKFRIVGLACNSKIELLAEQIYKFNPEVAAVADKKKAGELKSVLSGLKTKVLAGPEGLAELAGLEQAQMVIVALSGAGGLIPVLRAIEASKEIALANKESLVMAGRLVTENARQKQVKILPIDSEHSAIFQCLNGYSNREVRRLILTGSGGPLSELDLSNFKDISPKQALNHPRWKMGSKISIDSATLMNKGLEVIEARWLFDVNIDQIEVIIHPQAVVHSMVELIDGSFIAQMGVTDMYLPIQFALNYPERVSTKVPGLDLNQIGRLSFRAPDLEKFPCLELAYQAAKLGGSMPIVLNAADEELVYSFLDNKIRLTDIARIVEKVMRAHSLKEKSSLSEILEIDNWARQETKRLI